jgi:hypothetical protein
MTWRRVKSLTNSLLSGDTPFPMDDEESAIALLEYALEQVAIESYVSILISDTPVTNNTIRVNDDGKYVRRPNLPSDDNDIIDIDKGLVFAVCRLMASYLSRENKQIHYLIAKSSMEKYEEMICGIREAQKDGIL